MRSHQTLHWSHRPLLRRSLKGSLLLGPASLASNIFPLVCRQYNRYPSSVHTHLQASLALLPLAGCAIVSARHAQKAFLYTQRKARDTATILRWLQLQARLSRLLLHASAFFGRQAAFSCLLVRRFARSFAPPHFQALVRPRFPKYLPYKAVPKLARPLTNYSIFLSLKIYRGLLSPSFGGWPYSPLHASCLKMTYNIFDVVLHPSLFQQHAGEAPYHEYSYPPSVPVSMSSTSYIQSSNAKSDATPVPWNSDDWAEIRRRLWNAKHHTDSK